jgi:hypothetical protein
MVLPRVVPRAFVATVAVTAVAAVFISASHSEAESPPPVRVVTLSTVTLDAAPSLPVLVESWSAEADANLREWYAGEQRARDAEAERQRLEAEAEANRVAAAARVVKPAPTPAPTPAPVAVRSSSTVSGFLACVRDRESGGNYTIHNSGGSGASGAYQFMPGTWNGVASRHGRGDLVGVDPAAASPADQDQMAQWLYEEAGPSPWNGGQWPC